MTSYKTIPLIISEVPSIKFESGDKYMIVCKSKALISNYLVLDSGATNLPCTNNYMGASPNSEIEVYNVQEEIVRLKDRLKAMVSIHTAAKMVLTPWGTVLNPGINPECEFLDETRNDKVVRFIRQFKTNW